MTVHHCPITRCTTTDDLGNPLLINTPLCDPHRTKAQNAIQRMPRLYTELNMALAPGSTTAADPDRVTASKERPLGIATEMRAMQEDILSILAFAEMHIRMHLDWSPTPPRGREGPTVTAAARLVHAHLDTMLRLNLGYELDNTRRPWPERVLDLTWRARQGLGQTNAPPARLGEPCPTCEMKALQRANGASEVVCKYCGRIFTEADYDRLVLILTYGEAS